jgi:hypothetical protein
MRKLILCLSVIASIALSVTNSVAKEPNTNLSIASTSADIENYIRSIYNQINFQGKKKISFDAFSTAYKGYLNLKNAGKLNNNKQLLTIADFTLSSCDQRLWIIDLKNKTVLLNDYVAHGQGSGDEFARAFSNTENSHQSSIGFYVTGDTYVGQHGTSMRLHGMDNGFNSAAYDRAVVVHAADYVSKDAIAGMKRLGRSWGCPAVSPNVINKLINYTQGGTCMFIYYPQKNYLASSTWLNKKIDRLPEEFMTQDMKELSAALASANKKVVYEYAGNAQDLDPTSPFYVSPEVRAKREMVLAMNLSFIDSVLP